MKKYALLSILAVIAGLNALFTAQSQEWNGPLPPGRERMAKCLNLTPEQMDSMKAIHASFRMEKDKIWADDTRTPEDKRARINELHGSKNEQIRTLLTVEQQEKFCQYTPGSRQRFDMRPPVIHDLWLEKRGDFEQYLSDEEKKIIHDVRATLGECRFPFRGAGPPMERRRCPEGREQAEQMRERIRLLDPVINNHRSELEAVRDAIAQEFENQGCERFGNHRRQHARRFNQDTSRLERHFLLLDPDKEKIINDEEIGENSGIKLFPNPAQESLNIEFTISERGTTTIEMLDKSGNVMELIDQSSREPGLYSLVVDISRLKSGDMYYIRLRTSGNSAINKFVKL